MSLSKTQEVSEKNIHHQMVINGWNLSILSRNIHRFSISSHIFGVISDISLPSGPSVSCRLDPSVARGSEWAKPGSAGFWDPVPGLRVWIRGLRVAVCRWGQWIHSDPKSKYFINGAQSSPHWIP